MGRTRSAGRAEPTLTVRLMNDQNAVGKRTTDKWHGGPNDRIFQSPSAARPAES